MRPTPVVVTALGIDQILGWGSSFYFPAVLAEPIVADTGWSLGWVIGGLWYTSLQASVGFDTGYAINFITIITLYSLATCLYWVWFRAVDHRREPVRAVA